MHPFLSRFEQAVQQRGDRTAAGDQSLVLDYRSLHAVACGLSRQIGERSQQPRVGIMAPSSTACAAAILACWYAGKTPTPLNFLLNPDELGKVLRDAGLDLIVTIEHFAAGLRAAGVPTLMLDAKTLVPGRAQAPAARGEDVAVVIYTSGTSGDPKGVQLTFDNIVQNALSCVEHAGISADEVFVGVLPQFHSFGFTAMTAVPLLIGASVWYLPRFSPVSVVETIREREASVFFAIPSMFGALCRLKNASRESLGSLRLPVSGGEPLPPRVADAFQERFGLEILEGYGLTETSPVVSFNTPAARRRGSVGRPLPGVDVWAAGDAGQRLGADAEGELHIRGHCVMKGYLNKPEQTAAVLKDGVFATGDVGKVDGDGFLFITGRAKEMMIVGGENVFPGEIENVIAGFPGVAEVAVVGARDDVRGEVPVAFVIPQEGAALDGAKIRDFCRGKLAGYKVPRDVRVAEDLPRGPTGKILKRALLS